MLYTFVAARQSGKTTSVIEILRKDCNTICLVQYKFQKVMYPKELQYRTYTCYEFFNEANWRGRKFDKVIFDEGFLGRKSEIAKLYYELGRMGLHVIAIGTE